MKKITILAIALCSFVNFAQEKESNWKKGGVFTLLFNQSAFNNDWQGGGVNNIATSASINYDFNYKKDNVVWDNKVILDYGLTKIDGNENGFQKTNDKIEISSLYGKQANKYWYYSAYASLKTQFADGFKSPAQTTKISTFFSPAYLQAGPGMLWKKSNNLKVNITPASARAIFVDSEFTATGSSFGVEQGETSRFELGANVAAYYKLDLVKNVSVENILNLYANYLENAGNIDVDYTLNVVMKINEYLSANIVAQAIYDDNAVAAVQVREVFGLGFNYKF
ncbi:DUF3078 domain-containing protein [Wenyingzhuangia aestuarii]|uniref:DUF3078 domain-containing protein n=1 Tax=Wenyingzhuangia aestuarii TaxID=1647582 RepID=UPI00143AA38E|nr:DUF3078 domain-containing protein [Wenyingzhuangia aestuarii]NJB84062.1 hypothetical protein [Wenyingzhuangia aestuarii]